ncbi:MAG: acyl-ACP--UDP-N-acetylglucosamine O-acyltransferase [Candidatus Neomarinimicrobiota bacterium]
MHPTAIVGSRARLADDVVIGPYSVIGDDVEIGAGTEIGNFVTIDGHTTIGRECRIFHNTTIGAEPQDLKYNGEPTKVIIGDNVLIRESCTVNRGTAAHGTTLVSSNCLLMAYVHIAHDCQVGANAIFANQATLGGHVAVGDWASLGGGVMVHQFSRIGAHSFIGGGFRVVQDVPPFILAAGEPLRYAGINKVGLQRRGFSDETRNLIKHAYRIYFRSHGTRTEALQTLKAELPATPEIDQIISFIEAAGRGII